MKSSGSNSHRGFAGGRLALREYFRTQFQPDVIADCSQHHCNDYGQAIEHFLAFAGDDVKLRDVTDELLDAFISDAKPSGRSAPQRKKLAGLVRQVVLAWNENAVSKPRHRSKLPHPKDGTIRHYFEMTYAPEAMVGASDKSIDNTRLTLEALYRFVGHDVVLGEQTDKLAADFFRSLLQLGLCASTVNRYRRTWFAVWRHAFDRGLVERPPRVKRQKEIHNPPDAWSLEELGRLMEAALAFQPTQSYGAVPCNLWWRAILLVGYYTGLRRGSLLAIRRDDIDVERGLLYVPGENMKNRRGQLFTLGADAIAAIQSISSPPRLLLFPIEDSIWDLNRQFGKLLAAAAIAPGRRKGLSKFHKLRRTVATEIAVRAGCDAASSLLGHSSSYVTSLYIDPSKLPGHDVTAILPRLAVG